ncbi:MAG TPA: LysR family transcriptional regulator [Acidimicrobiales bacterium]|nr:LysR family transcriptional regulator [Acidimicrobiales bacterium]
MNLQQLRYVVATAEKGTMTRAAAELHVAQPALSRAVRALEAEIGVRVFEREGRGVRVTPQGREVVALARRILEDAHRIANLRRTGVLHVATVVGQARELGSPAVARYVAETGERVALDVVPSPEDAVGAVLSGRAQVGLLELPVAAPVEVVPLGWQEIVLLHPSAWDLDDPIDAAQLDGLTLLTPESTDRRHDTVFRNLRAAGIEPAIAAEANDPALLVSLVQAGAGAWFSYGREAQEAVAGGAAMVHITPRPLREIGAVHLGDQLPATAAFLDALRAEAAAILIPAGDPRLDGAAWISGAEVFGLGRPGRH